MSYRKGRAFEYLVQHHFESKGKRVIRSAGSHSPADLIVIDEKEGVCFVQCKWRPVKKIPAALKELADKARSKAYVICKIPGSLHLVHTLTYDSNTKREASEEMLLNPKNRWEGRRLSGPDLKDSIRHL